MSRHTSCRGSQYVFVSCVIKLAQEKRALENLTVVNPVNTNTALTGIRITNVCLNTIRNNALQIL